MQNGIATLKNSFVVLYEVKQTLTTDPETPLLSIYPREMNTYIVLTKASIQVFTVDLFVITSSWKYPSMNEGISKLWYIHTMEHN